MKTKKFYSKIAYALIITAIAFMTMSCKKSQNKPTVTNTYTYKADCVYYSLGANHFNVTSADEKEINAYLESKGLTKLGGTINYSISGETEDECDKKAAAQVKADWDAAVAKLVVSELQPKLQNMSEFTYFWYKELGSDKYDTIGKWSCPVNPNYAKYGKLTIDGVEYEITRSDESNVQNLRLKLQTEGCAKYVSFSFRKVTTLDIPEGEFQFEYPTDYQGAISFDGLHYRMNATAKFTKKGDKYDIQSSGTATTSDDSKTITFSLNCENVPF